VVLYTVVVNRKLKHYIYDITDKAKLKKLIIKCLFGTATSISTAVVVKEFGLTFFAVASNCGPIFTVILSYIVLRDKILREDMLLLVIVLSGIAVKLAFPEPIATNTNNIKTTSGYILLAYIPIGIAASNVLLRKMKGLHFVQINIYKIIIALTISSSICAIKQVSLSVIKEFTALDYTWLILSTLFQEASVIARKISSNHAPPSKLAHYAYLNTLYSFLFDLLIPSLGVHFNYEAYIAYAIIISGFSMKFILVGCRFRA
jgi:hypothetical protein